MPRISVGCDLVDVAEVAESLSRFGERYLARVFTPAEASVLDSSNGVMRLAARFAAKEAAVKALALSGQATPLREIEVVMRTEVPVLVLHGSMAELATERRWTANSLSLSHTDSSAMAVVVATHS